MHEFDLSSLTPVDAYKIMRSVVTPRPIALVTTVDPEGRVNAAPFSFFNAIAFDPCMVVLGLEARPDGSPKDTARNIRDTRVFVVNVVDEALAEQMNICSTTLAPGESEIDLAGLSLGPSLDVEPPRILEAPACLECRRHTTLEVGNRREIVVGEVVRIAIRADIVDPGTLRVDPARLATIGRLGGDFYASTRDTFRMGRPDAARVGAPQPDAPHPGAPRPGAPDPEPGPSGD
jgi:flavin reductase (DIM6/NTAB) family NADH-FMN oxidoreductase RutF